MAESPAVGPDRPTTLDTGIERAIRHAVYLTGGLVLLALGVLEAASALGEVASCLANSTSCFGGQIYYSTLPALGGGVFLLVVATVLFVLARSSRRSPPRG